MNPAVIRRVALIVVLILWFTHFWLAKISQPSPELVNKPKLLYKVRAYSKTVDEAEKIKTIGQKFGLRGNTEKSTRTISKFMGYIVVQDFITGKESEKVRYICEYLESKNYNTEVLEGSKEGSVSIRVGDIYPDERVALETVKEISEQINIKFDVKKYSRNTKYTTFVVVFSDIDSKQTAEDLKKNVETITSDTEMVSY
jgi:hypothetical protein